jgi:hypothetical protein
MILSQLNNQYFKLIFCVLFVYFVNTCLLKAQTKEWKFKVIAFYTAKEDPAHISFVHEANQWFSEQGKQLQFKYDSTNNWNNLNETFLSNYQVVVFLDTRPDSLSQRIAFQKYIEKGGAWMGFHFSAFALTPSAFDQNWDWYHETFLGSGEYKGNTWRPTNAQLKVEKLDHPFARNIPGLFSAAANEWYSWKNDLRKNKNIEVLLSIDSTCFPLGTGPKPYEIWHTGDYPVAWTNKKYRMLYFNIGHNDMDYDGGTLQTLSSSFSSEMQNRFILNSLLWLGLGKANN